MLPATTTPTSAPAAHAAASRPDPAGPAAKRWSASHGMPTITGPLSAKLRTSAITIVTRSARSRSDVADPAADRGEERLGPGRVVGRGVGFGPDGRRAG